MELPELRGSLEGVNGALDARLRVAGEADAAGLADLLSDAFGESWDSERVHRDLLDAEDVRTTYVIADGDVVLATASARLLAARAQDGLGYVHWVASSTRARGQGFGRAVTVAVLRDFAGRGLRGAVLETDDERTAAIRLYLALGFVPVYAGPEDRQRWSKVFTRLGSRPERNTVGAAQHAGDQDTSR